MKDKKPLPEALEGPDKQPGAWPRPERPTPQDERFVYPGEGKIFRDNQES
jgi:hypothetical protein